MENKNPFVTLKIKAKTAEEFKKYAKQLGKQQSEALQLMLNVLESKKFELFGTLGSNLSIMEKGIKKRINTVVAILKDIEKTQTRPTHEMIQLLFQEKPSQKKILVEKKTAAPEKENNKED